MKLFQTSPVRQLCLVLTLLFSWTTSPGAAGESLTPTEAWELLLRSPLERNGNLDALALAWTDLLSAAPEIPSGPPSELVLQRLNGILDYLAEPTTLEPRLGKLITNGQLDSAAHRLAIDILATLHRRRGDRAAEQELDPDRSFLVDWLHIGPFGTGARCDLSRRFPPEATLDLERTYDGSYRAVQWTPLRRQKPGRFVSAIRALGDAPGVYYHLCQVRRNKGGKLLLELRSSEPLWLFLNGDLVAVESADKFRENPRQYQASFLSGWNHVLVKSWGKPFAVRLLDDNGHALTREDYTEEALRTRHDLSPQERSDASTSTALLPTWRSVLDVNEGDPLALRAEMLAGRALLEAGSSRPDLAVHVIEEAIAAAPESAAIHYHAGRILERATHMPREVSRRRSRSYYEKAKTLDGGFLPARLALARFLYADEQTKSSLEEIGSVLERNSRYLAALVLLLGVYEALKWESEALETAASIDLLSSTTTAALVFRAKLSKRYGNLSDAVAHYAAAYDRDNTRVRLLGELATLEVRRGNVAAARERLQLWQSLRPDSASATFALADFLLDVGESDAAIALLRGRSERFPGDPRGLRRLGAAFERLGRHDAAANTYETLLGLTRGAVRLHTKIQALRSNEREPFDRFWEPFDEQLEDWIPNIPDASQFPKAGSVAVLDIAIAKVFPDGAVSEFTHHAILLLNEAAKEEIANVITPGEVQLLRTITPGGEVLEPVAATGKSRYVMPGLEPGAIVEFSYLRESSSRTWLLKQGPFYFQDYRYRQPMLLSKFVIIVPPNLPAEVVERGFKPHDDNRFARVIRKEQQLEGGWRAIVYEARDVPRLEPEEPQGVMPSREDYLPNVALVERKTIADIAARLRDTVLGKTRVSPELEAFARESIGALTDPAEKARALFEKVNQRIPNDSGNGDALGVFLESSGDRTLLYKALLDAAGIPNSWAFAHMRPGIAPKADYAHPEPSLFAKPLLLVEPKPDTGHWITLDARHAPFGKLPYYYEGGQALVLRSNDAEILPIPDHSERVPWTDSVRATIRLGVVEDDPLTVSSSVRITSRHYSSYGQKKLLEDLDKFRQRIVISRLASSLFPGAQMKSFDVPGVKEFGKPLEFHVDLVAPRFLQKVETGYLMRAIVSPVEMVRRYSRTPTRAHPYHLRSESVRFDRLRVELGDNFRIAKTPQNSVLASPLGTYGLRFYEEDGVLVVERRLNLHTGELSVDEFPQFLDFCTAVDEAESQRVVLSRLKTDGGE